MNRFWILTCLALGIVFCVLSIGPLWVNMQGDLIYSLIRSVLISPFIFYPSIRLGVGFSGTSENSSSTCSDKPNSKCFKKAAVSADDRRCSTIGADMLRRGGSAVDGLIAALVCDGVVNPYHSGIGGATFFMIYDAVEQKDVMIDCREMAPGKATEDMFKDKPDAAQTGPLAIAVPGEVKCFKEAHKLYGKLAWAELFQPGIGLARNGWHLYNYTAQVLLEKADILENAEQLNTSWAPYLNENGKVKQEGDIVIDLELAQTLEEIANDASGDTFYSGELAKKIIQDLHDVDSIIEAEDLRDYEAFVKKPINTTIGGNIFYLPTAPASGPVMMMMLNILKGYELDESARLDEETYHRIVEAMKHGYATRSNLTDPRFYPEVVDKLLRDCSNETLHEEIRKNITYKTHDIPYYNPGFAPKENHGTLHISVLDESGQAACATSTVNLYFGSKIRGKRTGITFNCGMDDFSSPGFPNEFDVPPSPVNFIEPGKRPVSSMTPTIVVDEKSKRPKLVVGGAGGTKITTGVLQVILNTLHFGYSAGDAVVRQRLHHQLSPNVLQWQTAKLGETEWEDMMKRLNTNRGHVIESQSETTPVVQAILVKDGVVEGASDPRHSGVPDGY